MLATRVCLWLVVAALLGGCARVATLSSDPPALLGEPEWDYEDLDCDSRVPFTVSFRNLGEVQAREVTLTARILDLGHVEHDRVIRSLPSIEPGPGRVEASFDLHAPDACGEDDFYRVHVTIRAANGDPVEFTTRLFTI